MQKKFLGFFLMLIIGLLPFAKVANAQSQSKDVENVAKIKAEVAKRGTGEKARVKIKLLSGNEVKGFISQAGANIFTVTDEKSGQQTEISYGEVSKVKGRGLSTGAKIGIFAAIGVGALVILAAAVAHGIRNIRPFEQ